jgi:hypothetical protein
LKFQVVAAVAVMALPAYGQYAGPAILSRGEAPSVLSVPNVRFTPYVALMAQYDSGLAGVTISDTGQLANIASYGWFLNWGVSGVHSWKHTRLGLAYTGGQNWYTKTVHFTGMNHNLMIGVTHDFSRRLSLEWRQTAGITSRPYAVAGLVETVPFDPSSAYIPTTDYFDNREIHSMSSLGLKYHASRRLSMLVSGAFFTDNRQSRALTNAWGTNATGDVQYRLSSHSTIGAGYSFMHFGYSQYGGGTDAHQVQGSYSIRLTRRLEFSAYAGVARIESKYIRNVPVDPALAAFLGITSQSTIGHFVETTPTYGARLARSFFRGVAYVSGSRGVLPGNGLFLTSVVNTATAGYNYTGFHRWSLSTVVGYARATAEGAIAGEYANLTETLSAGRQLSRYIGLSGSFSVRQYSSNDFNQYNRRITTASLGMHFSPGDIRLSR